MTIQYLPNSAADIAAKQGWNDKSLVIHLIGFIFSISDIHDKCSGDTEKALEIYLCEMAEEENRRSEA